MRFRNIAAAFLTLLSSHASAFDPTKASRYPSFDMYRPNVDQLTSWGPLNCAPGKVCSIAGMSVGGATLGGGLIPSVLTLLTPAQIADARTGSPTIDLAPVLNAALNTCMPGLPPPAVDIPYGVKIGVKSPVNINTCAARLNDDGGIQQIAGFTSVGGAQGIVTVGPNASGTSITGTGTVDGNRGGLISAYLAGPRQTQGNGLYVMADMWNCIHINAASRVTVDGLNLKGCMTFGITHFAGDRARIRNITVSDSSAVINAISSRGSTYTNISANNIGNAVNGNAIPQFTYAFGLGDCFSCSVSNWMLDGAFYLNKDGTATTAGTRIGDPYAGAFAFQRLHDTVVSGLTASGFSTTLPGQSAPDARAVNVGWSLICDNCDHTTISGVTTRGYYWGAQIGGSKVSLDNYNLDGEYNTASYAGADGSYCVRTIPSGQIRALYNSDSTYDHNAQKNSDDIKIGVGSCTRFGDGFSIQSSNVTINGARSNGNMNQGFSFWSNTKNNSYPASSNFPVNNVVISNVTARFNGGSGVVFNTGTNIRISNLDASNNGQESSNFIPYGIFTNGGFGGTKSKITISNWTADDTQGDAITATASFIPGTSTGKMKLVATDSSQLSVGQRFTVKAAGSSGADISAKIVDITDDFVTVSTAAGTVFDGSSCQTTALAGTLSIPANGNLATGSGTAFTTAINGPIYLKIGTSYYKVGSVVSDTQLQLDNVPSSAISGASATMMKCSMQGIKSQQYGAYIPAAADTSDIDLGPTAGRRAKGNTVQDISAAAASLADDWTPYTANITFSDGTGAAVADRLSSYRLQGTDLCIRGYAQTSYTTAPTSFSVGLPTGFTVGPQGGSAVGANTATRSRLLGAAVNGDTSVTMAPLSGALFTASPQYAQYGGCFSLR